MHKAIDKIRLLQRRWIILQLAADALFAIAVSLAASLICYYWPLPMWWCGPVFVMAYAAFCMTRKPWALSREYIPGYLNAAYPELEESCELVIKPWAQLNLLEQLQLKKVETALQQVPWTPPAFTKRLKAAFLLLLSVVLLNYIVFNLLKLASTSGLGRFGHTETKSQSAVPENVLPQINQVEISVIPPAYTGNSKRFQDRLTIEAEQGALCRWHIKTSSMVKKMSLLFNEKERVEMTPGDGRRSWTANKLINQAGFYQLEIDGKLSDLYQLSVIRDNPPVIRVKVPQPYTFIDAGQARAINVQAAITDDYGVSEALIIATVAKGSGEGVKFKEYKINFDPGFIANRRAYDLQKRIDLGALNMEPGDELYFYLQATDNYRQQSKTDVYIVSIQDTAELLSMDGILAGSAIKPEFFRSERQIIIETEALLKGRDTTGQNNFKNRSNDLGIDQKILRLRYGKFLGEQEESVIGDQNADELAKVENFSNAAKVLDAYTDKHDNAEDATFLEPAVKAQLKATLTEMWKAELHLRMYKPDQALPFEYKALRLLKDLQQKSRAFVAKTAYNPPPIKLEKRLSGDLSKITQPIDRQRNQATADQYESLKKAIMVLEQSKRSKILSAPDKTVLQRAGQLLSDSASARPANYFGAVKALHRILSANGLKLEDINIVEKGIQLALPSLKASPENSSSPVDMDLSRNYFKNLNRNKR